MWHGPYVLKCVLEKGSYELVDYEGTALAEPTLCEIPYAFQFCYEEKLPMAWGVPQ